MWPKCKYFGTKPCCIYSNTKIFLEIKKIKTLRGVKIIFPYINATKITKRSEQARLSVCLCNPRLQKKNGTVYLCTEFYVSRKINKTLWSCVQDYSRYGPTFYVT